MSRKQLEGTIKSDKMNKTVVVQVNRTKAHPLYNKMIRSSKSYLAHNETAAKAGDKVTIEETRPLSHSKHWQVIKVIKK